MRRTKHTGTTSQIDDVITVGQALVLELVNGLLEGFKDDF
jgi:hypothetical protein